MQMYIKTCIIWMYVFGFINIELKYIFYEIHFNTNVY